MSDRKQFNLLAAELSNRQDAHKERIAALMERALDAGVDPAGLRRFVAWKRQDGERRAQREAIDQQCRYLAGERDTPAELPIGCELHRALHCYRRKLTVRQAAEELGVSTGKAGNLYKLARMFSVHVHVCVDTPHDADGVITETAELDTPPGAASGTGDVTTPQPDAVAIIEEKSDGHGEGHDRADEGAGRAHQNAGGLVGPAAGDGSPDEGEDGEGGRPHGDCDAANAREEAGLAIVGAVARPSAAERVATLQETRSGDGASQAERPDTLDCGLTAPSASLGSPEREARQPTNPATDVLAAMEAAESKWLQLKGAA